MLNNRYKHTICLFAFIGLCCWLITACSDKDSDGSKPETVTLTISPSTISTIKAEGGTITLGVNCNTSWTANADQSWCTLSTTNGTSGKTTITLTVAENTSYDERNTAVTFKAGTATQKITVTQKQTDALLVESSEKVEVESAGGTIQIKIRANVAYSYSITYDPISEKDWIHKPSKAGSRSLKESVIELQVDENTDFKSRRAVVTITGGEFKEEVTVYQNSAKPQLILSATEYTIPSTGDTICIELQSNSEYSYELPELDWIKEPQSRAMSTYTHYFIIQPNESYDPRSVEIKFLNKQNNEEFLVTITQMPIYAIIVAQDKYQFDSEAHELELAINTNVEFESSSSADWLKASTSQSQGLQERKLYMSITANNNPEVREATLTLKGKGLIQTIQVIQAGSTDRIKLAITHEENTLTTPTIAPEINTFGTIDWGDGTKEDYMKGSTHTYRQEGQKNATFDVYGARSFTIDTLGTISALTIYINKNKESSEENTEIN